MNAPRDRPVDQPCAVAACDRAGQPRICTPCRDDLARSLAGVPALLVELEQALIPQRAAGMAATGRARGDALPYVPAAAAAAHGLRATLVSWTLLLAEETSEAFPEDHPVAIAAWLADRTAALAEHPAVGDAVDQITGAVTRAWVAAGGHGPARAGMCPGCHARVPVRAGTGATHCRTCRTPAGRPRLIAADEALTVMRRALATSDITGTPAELARLVRATTAGQLATDTLYQWIRRGHLAPVDPDARPRLFRLADVMSRLAKRSTLLSG